jgi:RHS repeat-associated protein
MIGTSARPSSNDLPPWLALGMFAVCWLALLGGMPGSLSPTDLPWARYLRGPDMGGGVGGLLGTLRHPVNSYERPVSPTASNPVTERVNLSNGRGDIVAQSDVAGTLTWTASYEAYGKRTLELGSNEDRQRANTKEEDPTGLLNEGFRYRDIETGVWLSRDPAGFVDGPNLYAYVKQNPWTFWDPDGLAINEKGRDVDDKTGKWNPNARLFKVTGDPKTGEVTKRELITSAKDIKTRNATIWVNGMANNEKNAAELGLFHTGKSEFYMIHNPSNGGLSDFGECSLQKLNLRTKVADSTRDILRQFDLKAANVTAHSQGTMILNSALSDLRKEGKDMRGMNITYHGAAANVMLSKRLARQIGANINVFKGHALDPVHNLVGMNTLNPLRMAGSLIASPLIFQGDRDLSPHSRACY